MVVDRKIRIQENRILQNDSENFIGLYGKRKFFITSKHSYGRALYYELTRFDITVEDEDSGDTILSILHDCINIREAIKFAIKSTHNGTHPYQRTD